MQRLEVSGAVRPIYGSLDVKRLTKLIHMLKIQENIKKFTIIKVLFIHQLMH